jgi:hypothetical protein
MTFILPLEIAPGQRVDIHPLAVDDLGQTILYTGYQVFLESGVGATTNNYLSDDGFLQIKGEPGIQSLISHFKHKTRG